ncbi:MAG: methyltransferase domain-containing protein [Patescibacteria group bacterium]
MESNYSNYQGAQGYLDFLGSTDGKTFKQVISESVLKRLTDSPNLAILDAGCGPGWLSKMLADRGHRVKACDISPQLIKKAKADYPNIDFQICDLTKKLPYTNALFDSVILSLSALDLKDQQTAFLEIKRVVKEDGRLIIVTVNPYYGFPVGVWKRDPIGRLLMKKPALKLRPYFDFQKNTDRAFVWNKNLTSYFYTLPEQINLLLNLGFTMKFMADIKSDPDDAAYSLKYRLHRFPIFVLMEFSKK